MLSGMSCNSCRDPINCSSLSDVPISVQIAQLSGYVSQFSMAGSLEEASLLRTAKYALSQLKAPILWFQLEDPNIEISSQVCANDL